MGDGLSGMAAAYQLQRILQPGNRSQFKKAEYEGTPEIHIFKQPATPASQEGSAPSDATSRKLPPARTIRLSGEEAHIRATLEMISDLQQSLDSSTKTLIDSGQAHLAGRKIFRSLESIYIAPATPDGTPPPEQVRKKEALEAIGAKYEELSGKELKERFRPAKPENLPQQQATPKSLYESVPDDAKVLVELGKDATLLTKNGTPLLREDGTPETNVSGVSGTVDMEALHAALMLKLLTDNKVTVVFHDKAEIIPPPHAKQAYDDSSPAVILNVAEEGQPPKPMAFDKLIVAPDAEIDRAVDTGAYNIQVARDRAVEMTIDLQKLGISLPEPVPFIKGQPLDVRESPGRDTVQRGDPEGKTLLFVPSATLRTVDEGSREQMLQELKSPVTVTEQEASLDAAMARFKLAEMGISREQLRAASTFSPRIHTRPKREERALVTPLSEKVTLVGLEGAGSLPALGGLATIAAHMAEERLDELPEKPLKCGSRTLPLKPEHHSLAAHYVQNGMAKVSAREMEARAIGHALAVARGRTQ